MSLIFHTSDCQLTAYKQVSITAPIASATNLEQLNELIEATTIELNPSVIDQLNQASV
jgi:aryl-alcohol dehydrogenase-like predicted oxidoreductase